MRFISYLRVSTDRQGQSGLGIEAQREAVAQYLNGGDWELLAEFVETESGKNDDRPQLAAALEQCRLTGATLVIAKLDRLSRSARFLLELQESNVRFVAADMPDANNFTVGIMALVAQQERDAISKRTKEALAAAKARGVQLGNPNGAQHLKDRGNDEAAAAAKHKAQEFAESIKPTVCAIMDEGHTSLGDIAKRLNERHIRTARGGQWHRATVANLLDRLELR